MNTIDFIKKLADLQIKLNYKNGNLSVDAPKGVITPELLQELKARKPDIIALFDSSNKKVSTIELAPRDQPLPMSYAQQQLWLLDKISGGSSHYNIPAALRLQGAIDFVALEKAFTTLVERHESLRTYFTEDDKGEPIQVIRAAEAFPIEVLDFSNLSGDSEQIIGQSVEEELGKAFDLYADLMVRVKVIKLSSNDHIVLVTMHHIASDGWSMGIFISEFNQLYNAFTQGQANPLPTLVIQYGDYAYWQRNWLQGEVLDEQLNYWANQLANIPAVHNLPLDKVRPAVQQYRGAAYYGEIDKAISVAFNQYCQHHNATLFMGLNAVFAVLIGRYSNQTDIVIGSPVANRDQMEVAPMVGFLMNNLVLRTDLSANPTFSQLLVQSKQMLLDAYEHQQVPFGQVIDKIQPPRSLSHSPLFQVMMVLQNNESGVLDIPGVSVSALEYEASIAKYDITLNVVDSDQGLVLGWEYNTDLFERSTIMQMSQHFSRLVDMLMNQPDEPVLTLPLLDQAEHNLQLDHWNQTHKDFAKERLVHQWFEDTVASAPDAVAVVFEGSQLSYGELNQKTNQLARFLIEKRQVTPDRLVGICLERSIEMVIAIVAIIKAGGAYLPLDPDYPKARLTYMLENASVTTVLTHSVLRQGCPVSDEQAICLDDETLNEALKHYPSGNISPESLGLNSHHMAYVIYTSGSTGKPKGVMLPHQALYNRIDWMHKQYGASGEDRILQKTPFSFDVSVWEFIWTLSAGACLVMAKPSGHKDPLYLSSLIRAQNVTKLHFVPSMLNSMLQFGELSNCTSIKQVFCSGEALPKPYVKSFFEQLPDAQLHNLYGPTEAAIDVSYWDCSKPAGSCIPIGKPINNIQLLVLDGQMNLVPQGVVGELHIGGVGLARGYLNRADLTAEKFVDNPFYLEQSDNSSRRLYKTGDLVRRLADGNLEFLGRIDHQVKVRGFRIELGEIEHELSQCDGVESALVLAREGDGSQTQLVAYVRLEHQSEMAEHKGHAISELKQQLRASLPDYMVPTAYVLIEQWPVTSNGKVNRAALPEPDGSLLQGEFVAAQTETERELVDIWREVLELEQVSTHANFFETGGNSLLSIKVQKLVQERTGQEIELTDIFEYPTIEALSDHLSGKKWVQERPVMVAPVAKSEQRHTDIAVIGMSGRFPGADNVEQFWINVRDGIESIQFFEDQQLLDAGVDLALLRHPNFVKSGSLLEGIEDFDAPYFGFTPREAELLDPQQRIMLECANEALEHSGYGDQGRFRNVGVFVGIADSLYVMENLMSNPTISEAAGRTAIYGNTAGFLSTRISYKLNLTGPSLNILTACSTSLVTVHQACVSLRENECEMALAGGGRLSLLKPGGYLFEEGGIESVDGHCRPFDQAAGGTRSGSGLAMVLLKRLDKALADKDTIHAVIKGSAVNNDAAEKVGYAAPSIGGQTEVIKNALVKAQVPPGSITFIETHGTGTRIGDPIEIKALQKAYGGERKGYCALGALKANIGHLDAAAGAAGLIKVVYALKHQQLPPSINFSEANSQINFEQTPFYVNTELKPWVQAEGPRRAAISSFGIGGTNVHAVLEEAPMVAPSEPSRTTYLIPISAKSKSALHQMAENLSDFLQHNRDISLHDAAYTLQLGRTRHEYSAAVSIRTVDEAIEGLQSLPKPVLDKGIRHSVLFMFPGQGAQYVNMALQLYLQEPLFKKEFDECSALLQPLIETDLATVVFPGEAISAEDAAEQLKQTHLTQPALFVIEYCMARLLMAWGITPDAMIGHSVGEYVAACLAGVFTLPEALKLVATRGRLMQQVAPGSMLSVTTDAETLTPLLAQTNTCLAAVNTFEYCVAAGRDSDIEQLATLLEAQYIECRVLPTSHAFHSQMMDCILAEFRAVVDKVELKAPNLRYVSNVTGQFITAEQVQDPQYWVDHLRGTVRFADGVETLLSDREVLQDVKVAIEVGPGTTLSSLTRKNPASAEQIIVSTLRHRNDPVCDMVNLQRLIGKLWGYGLPVDWKAFHGEASGRRIPLPTYPFERERYWIDPSKSSQHHQVADDAAKQPFERWWYVPTWKQKPVYKKDKLLKDLSDHRWLVVMDENGVAEGVVGCLKSFGQQVIKARPGKGFAKIGSDEYCLDIRQASDYVALLEAVGGKESITRLLHMASIDIVSRSNRYDLADFWGEQQVGVYSALYTLQALIKKGMTAGVVVDIVTNDVSRISGAEIIHPGKATMLSLCKVAPQEYPELKCHHIDVKLHDYHDNDYVSQLSRHIYGELMLQHRSPSIALRGNQRWEKQYENNEIEPDMPAAQALKDGGVYLITGGMGNIGLLLANYIAKTVKDVKLVLLGRTPLPNEDQWDGILAQDQNGGLCHQIGKIRALRAHGAHVEVFAVDVADVQQMGVLFEGVESRWGAINGLIHCAGQLHGSVKALVETTEQDFVGQYRSKVEGVMVLDELFSTRQPDFCLLMSSLSAVLGGLGFSAYAACNLFMDAFVQKKHDLGDDRWISVNWDGWDFAVKDDEDAPGVTATPFAMTPIESELAFAQVLATAYYPQVINSTGSLALRLRQWIDHDKGTNKQTLYVRPELDTDYVEPSSEIEQQLVTIWQDILGIEQIGVEDHFFDLGGDSLVATRVISAIRVNFNVDESVFSIREFFENPVIKNIAAQITSGQVDQLAMEKKSQLIDSGKNVEEGFL